jgi:hypothetical protein
MVIACLELLDRLATGPSRFEGPPHEFGQGRLPRLRLAKTPRKADDFQNRPYGSSVPIGVRDLGRGDYELTMATGPYRSRCVVSSTGDVRAMTPY